MDPVLPAELEYPMDDAGCKAYNEYLESVNQNSGYVNESNYSSTGTPYMETSNPLVPYGDTPSSGTQSPYIELNSSRFNTTPSSSPLTFIKEEEEEGNDLL